MAVRIETKEKDSVTVNIPITDEEKRKAGLVAAMNGWTFRWQIAQWVREGIEKDFPKRGAVIK